ncbi:MAG TPA: hypothetical protein VL294_11745 [Pseudolysinimonas sp.]|nr:hypothetical protein [Pseudolysinimonas sp.]
MDVVAWALRAVLALVFIGMGVTHFIPSVRRTMRAMIPPRLAAHRALLVALTGVCEIVGGVGIVLPWHLVGAEWMRWLVGILLVAFLVAVFPANAYAAKHPERFGRAAFPFWPRLIAQIVLIAAVVLAVVL